MFAENILGEKNSILYSSKKLFDKNNNEINKQTDLLTLVTAWVKDALEHHGIGAKTAVGYGRMK